MTKRLPAFQGRFRGITLGRRHDSTPTVGVVHRPHMRRPPMIETPIRAIDEARLEALTARLVGEAGAAFTTGLIVTGDKLGLLRALASAGALSSDELASRTGTRERYVREWLAAMVAGELVEYDAVA